MVACVVVAASNRRSTHLTSSASAAAELSLCCSSELVVSNSSFAPPRCSAEKTTPRVLVHNSNCSTSDHSNSRMMMTPSACNSTLLCHHQNGAGPDPGSGLGPGPSSGSGLNSNSNCCICSTTTTTDCVDQLKQQIRRAIENNQLDEANEVLSQLEKCSITKEILEATRVGAVINDIRKRMQETSPVLSKRCRALIKCWQKLLSGDQRPNSSCGSTHSNSVTPNAAISSPVVRRGLTPGTPKKGRLTSTAFSTGSLSALTSPAVGVAGVTSPSGSYAPQPSNHYATVAGSPALPSNRVSPRNGTTVIPNTTTGANHMHKSYTSVDLLKKSLEENGEKLNKLLLAEKGNDVLRNGKRKLDEVHSGAVAALTNGLGKDDTISQKRAKFSAGSSGSSKGGSRSGSGLGSSPLAAFNLSGGPSTTPDKTPSVSPPSKAQNGSGGMPHHPSGAMTATHPQHQKTLSEARKANVQSTSDLVAELSENLPKYMAINLAERENQLKKEQQGGDNAELQQASGSSSLHHHTQHLHHGLGLHAAASSPSISSLDQQAKKKDNRGRPPKNKLVVQQKNVNNRVAISDETAKAKGALDGHLDGIKEEGSVSNDNNNDNGNNGERNGHLIWNSMLPTLDKLRHREHFRATPSDDPSKSYIIDARGRRVIALPYLDTGLPDFVEYNYPEASKFYSEENFVYGAERPL